MRTSEGGQNDSLAMSATGPCWACGSPNVDVLHAREMMLGTGDGFRYRTCKGCGHLELLDQPGDWSRYYPHDYYSLAPAAEMRASWRAAVKLRMVRHLALRGGVLARFCVRRRWAPAWVPSLLAGARRSAAILDVGSGKGELLDQLAALGFRGLFGVDPFLAEDVVKDNGVVLVKSEIASLGERRIVRNVRALPDRYDFIMFHHSLEHVPAPDEALRHAKGLLKDGGSIIVRIPIASSYAFSHYRENWVQLDAPRHIHLFSESSFRRLCGSVGVEITQSFYDSTAFQFWGSERYRRGQPLNLSSPPQNAESPDFDPSQIIAYERQAAELNRQGLGDQAAFILKVAADGAGAGG